MTAKKEKQLSIDYRHCNSKMINYNLWGYQTGEVILPGLDRTIQLSSGHYFRNDGAVNDLEKHTEEVHKQFGFSYNPVRPLDAYGRTVAITRNKKEKISTLFVKDINDKINLFNLGHEATHVLLFFGMGNKLREALLEEKFLFNPFAYDDEEKIAHVGGMLGLYKKYGSLDFYSETDALFNLVINDLRNSL